jgi:hypothetical protein
MSTVVPHWMSRRLASRFVRVVRRRAAESPAIATFVELGVPKAEAYMGTYDKCQKYEASYKKEMAEGRGAVAALLKQVRTWVPLAKRDIPGFDATSFGDQSDVPDDVIEDGERLASTIQDYRDSKGNPLPYQKAALDGLTPALQSAAKEWAEAEAADSEYQKLLASVRQLASELQKELVALRRSLMAVVGRNDKDFQKLRVEHGGLPDDDDDANVPTSPTSVVVAPASGGASTGT